MNNQTPSDIKLAPPRNSRKKLRPVGQWHICSTIKQTEGGIIIPDTAEKNDSEFHIIASGPGKRDIHGELVPMQCGPGDTVALGPGGRLGKHPDLPDLYMLEDEFICCCIEVS